MTANQLEQLRTMTRIVADTGDFGLIKEFSPEDATTNPTLILKAAQKPEYKSLLEQVIADGKKQSLSHEAIFRNLLIQFGVEILKIVPNRVSTETSAKNSFDTEALLNEARAFISLYVKKGIHRKPVHGKLTTT